MARLPRLTLPGVPHHILQRGNNGQSIFSAPSDYELMLALIEQHARAQLMAVHAFVLLENRFHLLVTPQTPTAVAQMMQALGRGYVRHFNRAQGRTGTLWDGRYRSTLVEADRYVLPCMVFLDLQPVRAQLVAEPADYLWSSHAHFAGRARHRFLAPHPAYWALGNTPFAREEGYRAQVHAGLSPDEERLLCDRLVTGWPLGGPDFLAAVQKQAERRVLKGQPGRPSRKSQ